MKVYIQAVVRGTVQGLTEFLPISSSGHLFLLGMLNLGQQSLFFDIMLHISTLLTVVIVFRKSIWKIIKNPLGNHARFILAASVPTALMAAAIRYLLYERALNFLPFFYMVTTVMLLGTKKAAQKNYIAEGKSGYIGGGLITGICQGIACFSGVSRSGATLFAMRRLGMDEQESGELTFLLSIPIIIGSAIVEFLVYEGGVQVEVGPLFAAMAAAFFSGLFAVKIFTKLLKKSKLWMFAFYTFSLSIVSFFVMYF